MSLYNEDELVPPIWINEEFFEKVLKIYEQKDKIKISKLVISPASLKGDHSTTLLFRCKVQYTIEDSTDLWKKSLILKTMPSEEGFKRDVLKETKLFETEIGLYTEALPKIENILQECGEPTKLAAEIIYHSLDDHHKVIIFEDLCEAGYRILRNRYLNETEIKLVYSKLAKLHAISYMLGKSEQYECVTKFQEGIFSNLKILPIEFINQGITNFIQTLENHKELHVYKNKITSMQCDIIPGCKNLFNAYKLKNTTSEIFVLNHGDLHLKNLMFHFNTENHIDDVIMVDYQISCYAPSNIDMVFSQYLLLSPELRLKGNELMFYYFEEFIGVLKKMNYQGELPKYSDFQITSLKYRHFAIFLLATFLPLVHAIWMLTPEELKDINADKFLDSPEMTATAYDNPKFLKELETLLPSLLYEGFLD